MSSRVPSVGEVDADVWCRDGPRALLSCGNRLFFARDRWQPI
jgi:hypothetical protein